MKRMGIAALAAVCVGVLPLQAQVNPTNLEFGGLAFNHDIMMPWDFASLSQTQNFGTARSMAMGGAFTSLGADMASMSLNPAGLGMYQRNEFSLTPLVSINNAQTPGADPWSGNRKAGFAMANIGLAMNVYQSATRKLTSVTVGFGLNRIADFNSRTSFSTSSDNPSLSIADMFVNQLQKGTPDPNDPNIWNPIRPKPQSPGNPNGALDYPNPYFWPAVAAYKSALVHINPQTGRWERDAIGQNAAVQRSLENVTSGSINEFDLSFGANFSNIVYFGATLGIQSVYKRTDLTYGEDYRYPTGELAKGPGGETLSAQLNYSDLGQRIVLNGSGVNFKLGVVVRPIPALRLGVAYHTPTFYALDRLYFAGVDYDLKSNDTSIKSSFGREESPTLRSEGRDSWDFVSPSRLMFGASYTLGKFAIVSVDYERDWYNGIRVKNVPDGADFGPGYYKAEMKNNFCATNAVRAGIEVKPLPILALRVGGGYTSSMLKDCTLAYQMPTATESYYITAGVGVTLSRSVTLDLAYQNLTQKQTDYMLFYSYNVPAERYEATTDVYKTDLTRHFISMTLGVRF